MIELPRGRHVARSWYVCFYISLLVALGLGATSAQGYPRNVIPDLMTVDAGSLAGGVLQVGDVILGDSQGEVFLAVKQVQGAFASQGGNWSCFVAPESTGDGYWRFHMALEDANGRRVWVGESILNKIRFEASYADVSPVVVPEPRCSVPLTCSPCCAAAGETAKEKQWIWRIADSAIRSRVTIDPFIYFP